MNDAEQVQGVYAIRNPRRTMRVLMLMPAFIVAVGWPWIFWSTMDTPTGRIIITVVGIVSGLVFAIVALESFDRVPAPLSADIAVLRIGLVGEAVFELPWEMLREIQVERMAAGHRVLIWPHETETALDRLPRQRKHRAIRRKWADKQRIAIGVGQRRADTDQIVASLAALAGDRCQVRRAPTDS